MCICIPNKKMSGRLLASQLLSAFWTQNLTFSCTTLPYYEIKFEHSIPIHTGAVIGAARAKER